MFVYFGLRLLKDSRELGEGPSDELQEVEEELIKKKEGEEFDTDVETADGGDGKKKQIQNCPESK